MTTAGVALSEPVARPRASARWASVVEFLLVGGVTLLLFPLLWLLRESFGLDASELAVGFVAFHAAYVINDPHFSVTYLLFYKDVRQRALGDVFSPAQRIRYLVAGFVVPLGLAAWSILALVRHSASMLGTLFELMFLLVGWHYVKQGFGVLAVLWARRGIRISPIERAVLLGHCYAGWAYAWASPSVAGRLVEEKGVVYRSLAHPAWLELATGSLFALSTIALLFVLARRWRSGARRPPLGPLVGLLVSVWLWTVASGIDPLMVYVIPALHSLQYLYFVWLMKRNQAREAEGPPAFGRPVRLRLGILAVSALALGWLLFHGAPEFLDGLFTASSSDEELLGAFGPTPWFAAIFAFVNIHHYFMDHVIWRRENPEARHLTAP